MNSRGIFPTVLRQIGPNSAFYAVGDLVAKGSAFLLLPLYTRVLTAAEYGTYGIALSLVGILTVLLPLQLQSAVTVQYFQVDVTQRRELVSAALAWTVGSTAAISVFVLLTRNKWAGALLPGAAADAYVVLALGIAAGGTISAIPQVLMRMREQATTLVLLSTGTYVLGLAVGVIMLLRLQLGVPGLLLGSLFANVLAIPAYLAYLRREVTFHIPGHWFRNVVIIAVPLVPHMVAHWGLNLMDRMILQRFVPMSDVGIYQLGYQLGTAFQVVVLAVNGASLPYFFQRFGDPAGEGDVKRSSTWLVYVQSWIGLGIALLVPEVAILVLGPDFRSAVQVIPWIVLGFFSVALYHLWVNLLLYWKRTALVPLATILAALANLGLNLVLIPRVGYIGAAVSTAASYAVLAMLTCLLAQLAGVGFKYQYAKWGIATATALGLYTVGSLFVDSATPVRLIAKTSVWLVFPLVIGLAAGGVSGGLRRLVVIFGSNDSHGDRSS